VGLSVSTTNNILRRIETDMDFNLLERMEILTSKLRTFAVVYKPLVYRVPQGTATSVAEYNHGSV
jgi:hypothetical protein